MAASTQEPVVIPKHYDPMFKVDVMVHTPLREHLGSASDLKVDMMTLSLMLDTLCKQELSQQPTHRIEHGRTSSSFNDKVNVVYSSLQQTLSKQNMSSHVKTFFHESGLEHLFPRVASYVTEPDSFSVAYKSTPVDHYFKQMSHLYQVLSLARQIHSEVEHQSRPKYLAHQIAVLYQVINSLPSEGQTLAQHKSNIEENFKALKSSIAAITEDEEESLAIEVRTWVLELTSSIIQVVCSVPPALTEEMSSLAQVLGH